MNPAATAWAERIRRFAEQECHGSSPLYEHLGLAMAEDAELISWLASNAGPRANANVVFAAVHFLLLGDERPAPLAAYYPSVSADPRPPEQAYPAFREYWYQRRDDLATLVATRTTQTNEVSRSAYLLPAYVIAGRMTGNPLALIDVGAAAGLNLLFPYFGFDYGNGITAGPADAPVQVRTELRRDRPPLEPMPVVATATGIDLAPIDAGDADAERWLAACIWPEHIDRMRNLRAALALARQAPPRVLAGNAVDLLPSVAAAIPANQTIVVVNTNVLPYFSPQERLGYGSLIEAMAAGRDLVWIGAEAPPLLRAAGFRGSFEGVTPSPAAVPLIMTTFSRGERTDRVLAMTGPHARWIDWL